MPIDDGEGLQYNNYYESMDVFDSHIYSKGSLI